MLERRIVGIPEKWWKYVCLYIARADETCAECAWICVSKMIFVVGGMCCVWIWK